MKTTIILFITLTSSITFGQVSFMNITSDLNINHSCIGYQMGGGCAFFDLNNDGWQDIYITGATSSDALYLNNGDGTFSDITATSGINATFGLHTMGVATGDIDNDGYPEILITTNNSESIVFLKNNGDETFTNISSSVGLNEFEWSYSATFGDINKDGYLDLYIGNYVDSMEFIEDSNGQLIGYDLLGGSNKLYLNNQNSTFVDITSAAGVSDTNCNLATTFSDFDNDGDLDILNANDFGEWEQPNSLLENNYPAMNFSDQSSPTNFDIAMYGMGIAIGDYDKDMDLDYYITNIGKNMLLTNLTNGSFIENANAFEIDNTWFIEDSIYATGWGTGFLDVDNDSYLDLFVVNGYVDAIPSQTLFDPDKLYKNNGDGTFTDISTSSMIDDSGISRGFAHADFDNDGDVDIIVIPITGQTPGTAVPVLLYENTSTNINNWIQIKFQGTISNRDAIGTHIECYMNGESWLHEIMPSGSHGSQSSLIAHFGLGQYHQLDSILIKWPNGLIESKYNLASNQFISIIEGVSTDEITLEDFNDFKVYPNPTFNLFYIDSLTIGQEYSISMFDISGRKIFSKNIPPCEIETLEINLNSHNVVPGSYSLVISDRNASWSTPIFIR